MNDVFNNIELNELLAICQIINESDGDAEYVEIKHKRFGTNFQENLEFLVALKLVNKISNKYKLNNKELNDTGNQEDAKITIIHNLAGNKCEYRDAFYKYLDNFVLEGDSYTYRPSNIERLQYSSVRNLLMELDLVLEFNEVGKYYLNEKFVPYNCVRFEKYDLAKLERNLEAKKILGYKAECIIINYESDRVATFPIKGLIVEHTSQQNAVAGYDIKSWTYNELLGKCAPKYIEVKAVSGLNTKFYWTRNEIEQSKILGVDYYLYLLPVDPYAGFNIKKLEIIKDPFKEVFRNKIWSADPEVYCINKI